MVHNFSAGPSILPQPVFAEASQAVVNFQNSGLSILEISHRSKPFIAVMEECEALLRELMGIPESHGVIFVGGGASSQFFTTAYNLYNQGDKVAYLDTGTWSAKAIKEAKAFSNVEVVATSKPDNYNHIPKGWQLSEGTKYLHITTNNTIFGTQIHHIPKVNVPLIADMSSDILSRPIDVDAYDVIYAGAQKNLGPAGVTVVIVRKEALGKVERHLPSMIDYRNHIAGESAFNTPPVFPIYVMMLNLRWVKAQGGVSAMQKRNEAKAKLVYNEIDTNPCFVGTAHTEDRSMMNATFLLNEGHGTEQDFLTMCKEAKIDGIKGHRSVGGFRASMYNAMEISSAQALVDVMQAFGKRFG